MQRALVLGGGGVAGIAWLLGVVTAVDEAARVDELDATLGAADVLVGTSAGSVVATQLATGATDAAVAMQLRAATPERAVDFDVEAVFAQIAEALSTAATVQDAARQLAGIEPQQAQIDAAERRSIVAARLPVTSWPDRDLRICSVVKATGERVVFDRRAGVPLVDAVTASCAVPGVWPAADVAGRSFVDGGAWSLTNSDVAVGAGRTLVLVPAAANEQQLQQLAGEREQLGESEVLLPDDESVAAFGPNPLDPARRAAAFAAGRRQGAVESDRLLRFWCG